MIAIVTDSTAYITHQEAQEMNVVIVPMSYSFSVGHSYNEGCIEEDDAMELKVAEHIDSVHTSQATLSDFINTFTRLRRAGYDILCMTISSRLSGTYSNAMLAAKEFKGHIEVVDSLSTCAGLYLLIREANECIRNGMSLGGVAKQVRQLRNRVRVYFSVDDMQPLRRSGRLGNVRMSVSTVLNIKPMLEIRDGAVVSSGIARGKIDQSNKLAAYCKEASGRLIIASFLADEPAARLIVKLAREDREIERRRMGPVLGAHLGKGCLGVAFIAKEKV